MSKKELSAWEYKNCHGMFRGMIEWLEKFIEFFYKKEFPDWENQKQVRDNSIKRTDIYQYPEHARSAFSSMVYLFSWELKDYLSDHPFLEKEFKQEFYKWINAIGLTAENCPDFLKSVIFEVNQVLGGNFEKIRSDKENRKRSIEIDDPKYLEEMEKLFVEINKNNFKEKENEENLSGKKWYEIEIKTKFKGDAKAGEKNFQQIANSLVNHQDFYFVEQKDGRGKWEKDKDWNDKSRDNPPPTPHSQDLSFNQPSLNNKNISKYWIIGILFLFLLVIILVLIIKSQKKGPKTRK